MPHTPTKRTAYTLKRVAKVINTPAMPSSLVEAWGSLVAAGHNHGGVLINWDHAAWYFEYKGKPVALFVFLRRMERPGVDLHRLRQARALQARPVPRPLPGSPADRHREGREDPAGGVACQNKTMQKVAAAFGRQADYIAYQENLRPMIKRFQTPTGRTLYT